MSNKYLLFVVIICTGPFKNFPQLTVYHPSKNGTGPGGVRANAFINIGFTGTLYYSD